jgi:hypothetical protein
VSRCALDRSAEVNDRGVEVNDAGVEVNDAATARQPVGNRASLQ